MLPRCLTCLCLGVLCGAPPGDRLADALRIGPGIQMPRLLKKVEPKYTQEARANLIQGTALLHVVVTAAGRAGEMEIVSPLGYGLDESAMDAVGRWTFAPATRDGQPVPVLAWVEVNFRLLGEAFDDKAEKRRTRFNQALQTLKRAGSPPDARQRAVDTIFRLAAEKFPPAQHLAGLWKLAGEHGPLDEAGGLELVRKAADKYHGPAVYEIARRLIEGRGLPQDIPKGLDMMRHASLLGSVQAQDYLGQAYESGTGVEQDAERAQRHFRLCAAQGVASCQYRLARLLWDAPHRPERHTVQAVAWFQLAAAQGHAESVAMLLREASRLTPAQLESVDKLKPQLVRR